MPEKQEKYFGKSQENRETEKLIEGIDKKFIDEKDKYMELPQFLFLLQSVLRSREKEHVSNSIFISQTNKDIINKLAQEIENLSKETKTFDVKIFNQESLDDILKIIKNRDRFTVYLYKNADKHLAENGEIIYQLRYEEGCIKIYFTKLDKKDVMSYFNTERRVQISTDADGHTTEFFNLNKNSKNDGLYNHF